ncbi:RNA polymerase III RPC4-domain-containing protein [Hypoxylon trugodes]|uniref:RNA polymerase III RPC4-domain-containing protein n=1 Tax=Hypoxylon trugodes TaxID=326681 RepID=UPI00219FBD74|nr:RNA polymerase III RPC4-domain-containing protein [Hypoxylon trugodes]KAI1390736.1 RNA polymerase III RPC4-domain-containing protein [Hypoxylon trugodes]
MPPRGPRAGARGGRARGGASGRAGRGGAVGRAPVDEVDEAGTSSAAVTTQNEGSTDGGDVIMQEPPARETVETPATFDAPSDQPATTSSRQSQTPSATPSRAGGRFRPKNIRRDAAERAKLEEERNRALAIKIKEEEREQRAEERRAKRGRGRGRGDASSRGFLRRTITAAGPFSAIPQENVKGSGSWGGAGSSAKSDFSAQFNSLRYRPRRENEERLDTDLLSGFTGFTPDGKPIYQDPPQYSQKPSGSLPIGLIRSEHEEDEVKVKTTAELEAEEQQSDDEDLFVSQAVKNATEAPGADDGEVWHAAPKSQVKVKTEPGMDPDAMDVDMSDIPEVKTPHSPDDKKKSGIDKDTAAVAAAEKKKKQKDKAAKDPEVLQALHDLEVQLDTFRFKEPAAEENEGEDEKKLQEKDDLLFLFQLPPILPPLVRPTDDTNGQTAIPNPISRESSSGAPGSKIKPEDGVEKEKEWNPWATLPPEGGLIGKMNVRKSGKVEFDWGGTKLDLGVGTETSFLTTAMMVEQNIDLQNPEKSTGVACGMGEIMNKFVLVPIWDEEEDWDPDLSEIEGLRQ